MTEAVTKAKEQKKPAGLKPADGAKGKTQGRGPRRPAGGRGKREEFAEEFEQKIVDLARVTRVMAGGKRMRFRACVCVGDKKGRVGVGLAKGLDVTAAISKAATKAKKELVNVPIVNGTIPHEIKHKEGAAVILFKPASTGRGIIAGGAVRMVLELSGIHNITCKTLGTSNKVNNAKCVIAALAALKQPAKKAKSETAKVEKTEKAAEKK
ncbi:30S ribosomal protein S5 [Candidatus Falkowbacteria bacterium]|nr:30S ribosomal protein S5 [Candidatus Falkowbacteria bacterium]